MTDKKRRGRGRPPTRWSELRRTGVYLTPETAERYKALAKLTRRAGYEVVEMAVLNHWKRMPEEKRRLLEEAVERQKAKEAAGPSDG